MSSGRLLDSLSLSLSLLSEHYLCGGGKHPMRKTLDFAQNTQKLFPCGCQDDLNY